MPPSPLDDRIVVALPRRPIRPQELHLCLDTTTTTTSHHAHHAATATHHAATTTTHHAASYLDVAAATATATATAVSATTTLTKTEESSTAIITSTTVVKIRASSGSNLTYMPSSSGSTRSLTCGCSSASCCTVSTYEKDASGSSSRTQQQSQQQQQHSYSYHHHHTQPQQVSASSPDLSSHAGGGGAGGFGGGGGSAGFRVGGAGPSSSIVGHSEALSAPSLTSTERERALPPPPPSLPASTSARPAYRVIHPNELAKRLGRCPMGHAVPVPGSLPGVILIDCRPFMEYNKSHIQGAVHINCSDKISRRRLQQGKITVLDLISCRADEEGKDSFRGLFSKEIVVYDESTAEPARLSAAQPLHVVLESLRREGKDPIVLKGGLSAFRQQHAALCEHSLHLHQEGLEAGALTTSTSPTATMSLSGALPHSLPSTPDIENAELTPILPFLYLGNEHDAQDLELMQRAGIGFILNVTTHLPLFHYDRGLFSYKRLPATDSNKQNLRQYFEEAFEFIEEAQQAGQGVLIHCQAGVSRSATIVIAYLMKHSWMTMSDAYKFVKARRPIISPNLNFMGQLLEFGEDLNSGVTPRILTPKLVGMETMV